MVRVALGLALICGVLNAAFVVPAGADEGSEFPLTFCRFGPNGRVFPVEKAPGAKAAPCEAHARIQSFQWECVPPEKVLTAVETYRKNVREFALRECEKFCARQGRDCQAKVDPLPKCGLGSDLEEAVAAGKKFGCRSDCSGRAYAYCSIYDTGYRLNDPVMLAKSPANCHCFAPER